MIPPKNYQLVEIESFEGRRAQGAPGAVLLRPVAGQPFPPSLLVEGNKSLVVDYPVGSRFKIQAALSERPDGSKYLFSSWQWDVVVREPDA